MKAPIRIDPEWQEHLFDQDEAPPPAIEDLVEESDAGNEDYRGEIGALILDDDDPRLDASEPDSSDSSDYADSFVPYEPDPGSYDGGF